MIPSSEHFLFHAANAQKKAYEARKLRCKGHACKDMIAHEAPARRHDHETFYYANARLYLVLAMEAKRMEEEE